MSPAETQSSADLSTAELEDLEEEVSLPYTIEDVTLMSPGTWNDIKWTGQEIQKGMSRTDFSEDHNNALFLDHEDRDSQQWIGRVENIRMSGDDMIGDLNIVDKETAIKLEFGAKFGISPKVTGRTDGRKMKNFEFDNFSVVVNPAVKTTFLNSELIQHTEKKEDGESTKVVAMSKHKDKEEMAEHEVHEPEFTGTTTGDWNSPDMEDFDTDDLSEIDNHFMVSEGGFPPENFSDLSLPVVEPNGDLNVNALQNAKARAGQVEGLPESDVKKVKEMINELANENFDVDFEPVENEKHKEGEMDSNDGEMAAHGEEEMEENDITENQEEYNRGDSTMSDTQESGEAEPEAETSDQEVDVDEEALAQRVAEILEDDGDEEDAEAESEAEEEEVENEEEEVEEEAEEVENEDQAIEAETSDFQEFVSEKMEENPEMSFVEAAKEFEQAQRSEAEKVREEVKEEMSQKIDELKSEIEEMKTEDEETEAQRATQTLGEQRKEAKEEVKELSDEELNKGIMKQWLSNVNGGVY